MRFPRVLRRLTDPPLERVPVPIVGGVNRGRWWTLVSAGGGYASGRRADAQMKLLQSLLRPDDIVWDIGAHHGYVSLCAARKVGPGGVVHAFEPSARNRRILERHVRWNAKGSITVHPWALGSFNGTALFGGDDTSKTNSLGGGDESVQVRTGTDLVKNGGIPAPTFLKVDVEGAEAETLAGLLEVLTPRARLLIAMHSPAADQACVEMLEAIGFTTVPSRHLQRCRTGHWDSDPDLFAFGPDHAQAEVDQSLLAEHGF